MTRGFKISLGRNLQYTFRAGPLYELEDLTHFPDQILGEGQTRPYLPEMGDQTISNSERT